MVSAVSPDLLMTLKVVRCRSTSSRRAPNVRGSMLSAMTRRSAPFGRSRPVAVRAGRAPVERARAERRAADAEYDQRVALGAHLASDVEDRLHVVLLVGEVAKPHLLRFAPRFEGRVRAGDVLLEIGELSLSQPRLADQRIEHTVDVDTHRHVRPPAIFSIVGHRRGRSVSAASASPKWLAAEDREGKLARGPCPVVPNCGRLSPTSGGPDGRSSSRTDASTCFIRATCARCARREGSVTAWSSA